MTLVSKVNTRVHVTTVTDSVASGKSRRLLVHQEPRGLHDSISRLGGARVSECCELRIKDIDFDQGLVIVRRGKGDKGRATLLAELGRDELHA